MPPSYIVCSGSRLAQVRGLLLALSAVVLGGCSSTYRFTVDGLSDPEFLADGQSYRLVLGPTIQAANDGHALAPQVLQDLRTALSSKGLYEAPDGISAALEIDVDLGIGRPEVRVLTHTEPVYMIGSSAGSDGRPGDLGRSSTQGQSRKIGDRTVVTTQTRFRKFLRLSARASTVEAGSAGKKAPMVWTVFVTNNDESNDLSRYARLMVAAAMDMVGRNGKASEEIVLSDRDKRVVFVARGIGSAREVAFGEVRDAAISNQAGG